MKLLERLREFENQYVFIKWALGAEYGKLLTVGEDFLEFAVINVETMEYSETMLINASLLLEVAIGGADVARIIAEVSSRMSIHE